MKKKNLFSFVVVLLLLFNVVSFADTKEPADKKPPISSIEINGEECKYSEVLTFEQMVSEIAKENNVSEKTIEREMIENNLKKGVTLESLKRGTYRSLYKSIYVTSRYRPTIRFYCRTEESSYHWATKEVLYISMNRRFGDTVKQFRGDIFANLETPARLFFNVNGDFYNKGTTNYGGGVNIGVGEWGSVSFSGGYASGYYEYYYGDHIIKCGQ